MGSPALKSYPLIRTHSIRTRLSCEDLSAGHTGLCHGSTSANGRTHSACSILHSNGLGSHRLATLPTLCQTQECLSSLHRASQTREETGVNSGIRRPLRTSCRGHW